ncbi:MAG: response regulator transcription factor [Proteobacteria bacterium]|nr:response regulator transcription factor [Pseudomonadota bacterium]
MIRVLIVDDHKLVRDGLKQILAGTGDISVVGEAGDGEEAVSKIRSNPFDVVLLDIRLPKTDGLSILKLMKQERPDLYVLMLSMYPEEQYAIRALKSGASGYLTKDSASEELIAAIRKVALGQKYVTLSLAEKLAVYLDEEEDTPIHETLSDREYQVMRSIAQGSSVGEIAEELHLSVKTISTYRSRLLNKLNVKKNADIIRYAIKHDIVT